MSASVSTRSGTCACSTHRSSGTSFASSEDQIHEGHWVLLDQGINLGIGSRELLHELIVEVRVLHHPLSQLREVGVVREGCEGVSSCSSSSCAAHIFISVVVFAHRLLLSPAWLLSVSC